MSKTRNNGRVRNTATISLLVGLGIFGLAGLIWRFGAHRHALPCPVWLRWMVELDNPFAKTSRADAVVEHLDLQPGMRVLDIGCGPGRVTVPAALRVVPAGEVVAIDLQEGMLRRAEERVRAASLSNVRFVQAQMGSGELRVEPADRAILVTVLGEIPEQEAALREIFDALKPGGVLSITEIIFDPHFQSRGKVARMAARVGFQEKAFFGNRLAYTLNLEKPRQEDDR